MPVYCKGKGGICAVPCTNEACEHYDGTGAKCIPTVADRLRSMTDLEWVDAIEELLPKLCEAGDHSLPEQICDGEGDCGTDGDCNQQRHRACIMRFLLRPAETFGDDDRDSGLVEDLE